MAERSMQPLIVLWAGGIEREKVINQFQQKRGQRLRYILGRSVAIIIRFPLQY